MRCQFNSRPLSEVDVKSVMADLDYHSRDYRARGITEYQEVLRLQPENVVANRGLGYDALQKDDLDKASEYFRRAAAQDVKDPRVHYLLAMMMSRKGMSSANSENLDAIQKELKAAIALEPNYAEAYNLLGMTLSFAGEKEEAIDSLNKAIALSPRNPWYAGNLASAYLQAQDFEHAIPLLQELQKSSSRESPPWLRSNFIRWKPINLPSTGMAHSQATLSLRSRALNFGNVPDEAPDSADSPTRAGNSESARSERTGSFHEGRSRFR